MFQPSLKDDGHPVAERGYALAQRPDVLQRGRSGQHMLATHPAGHQAVQLPGRGFVDLVAGVPESAHGVGPQATALRFFRQPLWRGQHQQPGGARSAVFGEGAALFLEGISAASAIYCIAARAYSMGVEGYEYSGK